MKKQKYTQDNNSIHKISSTVGHKWSVSRPGPL